MREPCVERSYGLILETTSGSSICPHERIGGSLHSQYGPTGRRPSDLCSTMDKGVDEKMESVHAD